MLLLVVSAVLANVGAYHMEAKALEAADESNTRAAELVADNVLWLLRDLSRSVVETAQNKHVRDLLRHTRSAGGAKPVREYHKTAEGQALDQEIRRLFQQCNERLAKRNIPTFATWFFLNNEGKLVGLHPSAGGQSDVVGQPFGGRDYFVVAKEYATSNREELDAVHISQTFKSRFDDFFKFAIAMPVLDDDKSFLGVLEASIPIHHTLGLRKEGLHHNKQKTILVGRVDRSPPAAGLPGCDYDYHVLLHEAFEGRDDLRRRPLPFTPTTAWPGRDAARSELLSRIDSLIAADRNYEDPLAAMDRKEFAEYKGRWLAGFARVGNWPSRKWAFHRMEAVPTLEV